MPDAVAPPSTVAEIETLPGAIAVTRPLALTAAMPDADVDQLRVRPVTSLPLTSLIAAPSCTVCPTSNDAVVGDIETDATSTGAVVGSLAHPIKMNATVDTRQ